MEFSYFFPMQSLGPAENAMTASRRSFANSAGGTAAQRSGMNSSGRAKCVGECDAAYCAR